MPEITAWDKCQQREKAWWERWKARVDLKEIRKDLIGRALKINAIMKTYLPNNRALKLLQIGPAANGEIHFLEGERYAIDPLAAFFKENFSSLMDPKVDFIEAKAEKLPYPGNFFDGVLIINVLDHCADPLKVLDEICRCLKPDGILVVHLNLYTPIASYFHKSLNFLDPEHPHAITKNFLAKKTQINFNPIKEEIHLTSLPDYNPIKKLALLLTKTFGLAPENREIIYQKKNAYAPNS